MNRPLLSYYGDDLTGSTDVMEALSSGGVPTVLFLAVPEERLLARFADCRAFGIAGTSRSETPSWMDANLPAVFEWLKTLGAEICHYKVCSTFDSSPTTGSIGRAIEIGSQVFSQRTIPLVVGAPQLKRYTVFGNLFAAYRGKTYRIDRHPVMSRHPVTPMTEADLLIHLSHQTSLPASLVDVAALSAANVAEQAEQVARMASCCSTSPISKLSELRARRSGAWQKEADRSAAVLPAWNMRCFPFGHAKVSRLETQTSRHFPPSNVLRSFPAASRRRQRHRYVMRKIMGSRASNSTRSAYPRATSGISLTKPFTPVSGPRIRKQRHLLHRARAIG